MPTEPDKGRFRRLGRRILGDEEGRSLRVDAREILGALAEGGGHAKTEIVRAIAREVRVYLEELGLKEDLHRLATNYSFEVRASVHLRRLDEDEKAPRKAMSRPDERPPEAAAPVPRQADHGEQADGDEESE